MSDPPGTLNERTLKTLPAWVRRIVAAGVLPLVPGLAVFLRSGLAVDRIVWGVAAALLAGAISAWLTRRAGGDWIQVFGWVLVTVGLAIVWFWVYVSVIFAVGCPEFCGPGAD